MTHTTNLPLPDRAGRGDLERKAALLAKAMTRATNEYDFNRLAHQLDKVRADFHKLYGVKEHPAIAPLQTPH